DSFSDTQCWQYDFYIDPCSAFIQQGDTSDPATYWLVVEADPHDENAHFGVKTRDYYDGHYKDDAVWSFPGDEDWQELRYPRGHQFFDESIDLAFAITTADEPEQPYSHPDQVIWDHWFYHYDVDFYGWEYDPRSGDTGLAKFEFYQDIFCLDWWNQQGDDGIYWLGLRALYSDITQEPNYPWGWQTRPHFFMDDAVRFFSEPQLGGQYPAEDFEPIKFDSNSWDLSFELIGKPPGDHCYDPVLVTLGPNDLPYTNTNFTYDRGNDYNETCLGSYDESQDIIYELNVTEAMDVNVTLDPCGTLHNGIALDDSCPPDNPCMKFSRTSVGVPHGFCVHLEPGTYYIMVDTVSSMSHILEFSLTIDDGGPSPANDDCNNAEPVSDVVNLPFDTTCATFDGNGICMYSPNIWYCYTATCTGFVTVSLCGSSYDTKLAVYNGCDCYPVAVDLIECNDDSCGFQSQITFGAVMGNDYLIEVGGYGNNTGQGLLNISCCPAPANDDCNDAEPVSDVADLPFDTTCATTDGNSPCVLGSNIWYCYTATCTGDVTVSLCGSSFDTMVAVYDDCNCYPGAGDMIVCNDDFPCPDGNTYQSEANFPAIAGNDYLIEVGGWSGKTGPGLLSISCEGEALDFGDAPDPNYPTLLVNDGARHVLGGPYFCDPAGGDAPDAEADGQPHPWATGDDTDGNDDEDGVNFPPLVQGQPGNVTLNVCGGGGVVDIWIDYNGDGDWGDPGEFEFSSYLGDGPNTVVVDPPPDSVIGHTFARCRISSLDARMPTGQADDGEVEDHMVEIKQEPTCWCADYNSDNIVDFADYADFADGWGWTGPAGGYNNSDLNCDGVVDFKDLAIFAEQWLDSCP
ncbi:MAG: GEVED domain-containing protein, partial [Planctomycetota bacterium]